MEKNSHAQQESHLWIFPLFLIFSLIGGCGKNEEPTDPGDLPIPELGRFLFTLDSAQCNTTGGAGIDSTGWIIVVGATTINGSAVTVGIVLTNASYPLNTPIALADPDLDQTHGGAMIVYGDIHNPSDAYFTEAQGATGTVKIVTRSNTQISGTCSFKARQLGGVGQKILNDGAFNVVVTPMQKSVQKELRERISATDVEG